MVFVLTETYGFIETNLSISYFEIDFAFKQNISKFIYVYILSLTLPYPVFCLYLYMCVCFGLMTWISISFWNYWLTCSIIILLLPCSNFVRIWFISGMLSQFMLLLGYDKIILLVLFWGKAVLFFFFFYFLSRNID